VTIERVDGDANVHHLKKRVIVGKVDGDLYLWDAAGASIESVGGDCALREVADMVEIARVGGDLVIAQAKQALVGDVGGDLEAESVKGKFESRVGGDVELSLTDPSLAPIRIIAGGDIQLAVPENANALLALTAGGEISIKTANHQAEYGNVARDILLGQGGERVELKAGGDIFITDKGGIPSGFDKMFNGFDRDWQEFSNDIDEKIEEGLKKAYRSSKAAVKQVEQISGISKTIEEAFQRTGSHKDHPERSRGFAGITFEKPAEPAAEEKPHISENERMIILKMLAEKKITVDEADKLLKALEG
jgi:hypothetical protein